MFGSEDVVKDRHALPQSNVLERTRNTELRDLIRRLCEDRLSRIGILMLSLVDLCVLSSRISAHHWLAHERNQTVGRLINACDAVKRSRFAGTVRADERDDLSLWNIEGQIVDRDDAAELHSHILKMQRALLIFLCLCTHRFSPPAHLRIFPLLLSARLHLRQPFLCQRSLV